jgi:hypothetical protein
VSKEVTEPSMVVVDQPSDCPSEIHQRVSDSLPLDAALGAAERFADTLFKQAELDEDTPETMTVLKEHSLGARRHTHASPFYRYTSYRVVKRPTEIEAFKRIFSFNGEDDDALLPLMKTAEHQLKRYCFCCGVRKDERDFDIVRSNPGGLSWYCKVCRVKTERKSWRQRGLTRTPIL